MRRLLPRPRTDEADRADPADVAESADGSGPGGRTELAKISLVLMLFAVGAFVVAAWFALRPVTNPGVQQCGSPLLFTIGNETDVRIPAPGAPDEPANARDLRSQPRCRQLVDDQLSRAGLAVVAGVVLGLTGAVIGLVDDRARYRRAPAFESYLRERPPGVPADPWNQPVVPVDDLGERLPDLEWREVRVVVGMGVLALVALPLLAPWSAVRDALGHVGPGWLLVAVVLVAASYPVAALGVTAATDPAGPRLDRGQVTTSVAASFTGRLLPEYGTSGLVVHRLVRSGAPTPRAVHDVAVTEAAAVMSHAVLLALFMLVTVVGGRSPGTALAQGWAVWLFVVVMLAVGAVSARRRWRTLVVRPDRTSVDGLIELSSVPKRLVAVLGSCVGLALVDALVVVACVAAFGGGGSLAAIVVASLLASVVAVLAPTPDGAGAVEAALVLGLVWAGVDAGPAVAAALASRVLAFWLPMLPGWLALRRLREAGEV